jgi:hypothetical protein
MPAKRKIQDSEGTGGSEPNGRKKGRIQEARQIVTQVHTHAADGTRFIVWTTIILTTRKGAAANFPYPWT